MSKPDYARMTSLALLSGSGLFLEIALTRLFSTLFYPHYVFAILSLAVLGIGLGAALATWRQALRRSDLVPKVVALAGPATLALVILAVRAAAFAAQIPLFLLVILPFVCIGLALATFFSAAAESSPRLYWADLMGAGLGALLVIPALNLLGAINSLLLVTSLFGLAGWLAGQGDERLSSTVGPSRSTVPHRNRSRPDFVDRLRVLQFPQLIIAAGLIALASNLAVGWLDLDMSMLLTDKPIVESLEPGGRVVRTIWDSFARTDLVDPANGGPYRLYMDGAAGSVMPPAENNDFLLRDIGLFPFATAQPALVFVIGPGGGLDVWFGLQSGAAEIVAVEVNPASVALVEQFAAYNGALYDQPTVRVVVDEGRSVLRREQADYDLIFLSQVVTLAAERSGYALVENTTYTVEAFEDYLAHLSPGGQIAIKLYDEPTLTRALSTALAAFRQQGLSDADGLRHIAAFLDPRSQPPIPLLIVRKAPFTRDDALELGAVARRVGFAPLFLPDVWAQPPLDDVQAGLVQFSDIMADAESDISPTSDDRPFFYQFERGIPRNLQPLLLVLAGVLSASAGLLLIAQRRAMPVAPGALRRAPLYFAALGLGFMAVEVAIIQQTRLFLGHPTLTVTIVLAVLLVAGGVGSGLAGRRAGSAGRSLAVWPAAGVALLLLFWMAAWPLLNESFLTAGLPVRVLVVVISLLPLALLMGMPFPLGLRHVGQAGDQHVALGWAVNGVMTVAGSASAVTLAILTGFSRVLLLGVVAYAVAALLAAVSRLPDSDMDGRSMSVDAGDVVAFEEAQSLHAEDQRITSTG